MRIIDGLNLPGWRVEIPDCSRNDLPEFFKDLGLRVGAEIGVWKARFSEVLCRGGLEVYAIDQWQEDPDCVLYGTQEMIDKAYSDAMKRLHPYIKAGTCHIIRKASMEAVKDFADGSLDWVYIDGNHSFAYVAQDVFFWSKKVRKGGVIAGHDYIVIKAKNPFFLNVKEVIDAYTRAVRIPKWYVLGEKHPQPGHKRDKERSWMWLKE